MVNLSLYDKAYWNPSFAADLIRQTNKNWLFDCLP
jgi:hypothetical protein